MKKKLPPEGVLPLSTWLKRLGRFPTLHELNQRYQDVAAAVLRYRQAGLLPLSDWLCELVGPDVFMATFCKV